MVHALLRLCEGSKTFLDDPNSIICLEVVRHRRQLNGYRPFLSSAVNPYQRWHIDGVVGRNMI